MAQEMNPAEQAAALVEDPTLYETYARGYSDEVSFYSALRGDAQHSLSFEEYVELRRVFLDRGPAEAIRRRLEDRLDRSLKNMVLGDSPRGRAYAVHSLADLEARRQRFATLDIEVPSLQTVAQTTLEHLYDAVEAPTERRETLSALLTAVPSDRRTAVEHVARAHLSEVVLASDTPDRRLRTALDSYVDAAPAPTPPDGVGPDAADYAAAAEERAFADPAKRRLYEAALHESPTVERLGQYLYLTAADAVEAYRHGDQDVTRTDFVLARRHLRLLRTTDLADRIPTRTAYVDSYFHLARAIEAGGGRWLSTRAGRPPAEWQTVAERYARAATAVHPVSTVRFVKYLSKAFRHAAHALDAWESRYWLHGNARRLFERLDPEGPETTGDVDAALAGTLQTHRCRECEARAHVALAEPDYEEVQWAAARARSAAAKAPQDSLRLRNLDAIEQLAAARQAERRGEFDAALATYESIDTDDDAFQVGVRSHRRLCELKALLEDGADERALSRAHEWFGQQSAIVAATEAACGLLPAADPGDLTVSDQFVTLDTAVLPTVLPMARLSAAGGPVATATRRQILDCLLVL